MTKKQPELTPEATLEMPVETTLATTGEMPDFLAKLLGLTDGPKSNDALYTTDPDVDRAKMVYGAIPQPKSPTYHMKAQTGYWYVGRDGSDPAIWPNPDMKEERRLMLIEHVGEVSQRGSYTNYKGARQMWHKLANGERGDDGILCQSANGDVPYPFFVGRDYQHPITGMRHRIGFGEDGKPLPVDNVCGGCPFSKFVKLDGGGFKPAPCKPANHWVFYDVDEDTVFVFRATNSSMQTAFEGNPNAKGKNGNEPFCVHKGTLAPFEGIGYWFTKKVSTLDIDYTDWAEVPEEQRPFLAEVTITVPSKTGGKAKTVRVSDDTREAAMAAIAANMVTALKISVPVTRSMPNGLLDKSTVYPVMGFVSQTNGEGAALVPDFRLADAPLTEEELEAFEQAREAYFAGTLPDFLRGTDHYEKVAEKLVAANPQITAPGPVPALPPWSSNDTAVEGEVVAADLMADDE